MIKYKHRKFLRKMEYVVYTVATSGINKHMASKLLTAPSLVITPKHDFVTVSSSKSLDSTASVMAASEVSSKLLPLSSSESPFAIENYSGSQTKAVKNQLLQQAL